ncbi:ABC transporter ATP-binding protein [Nesterenkonia haasae]|uniref:ABC transporter ATP-binding protein n=1 Tax=Nesterenkonia haasae TaxID=2587813 RepID=UPI001391C1B8|nr:ABC transporter ATP-binding protein [Nesterenkonia haasae]NDK32189.1 ABC transporter ATP-binding protein [Nesterenkonia haasae]
MANPVISAQGLRKVFRSSRGKEVVAVDELTMEVEEGTLTAFLGPNGAGKSTSLRMLITLMPPTAGKAQVCGHSITDNPGLVRSSIGYVGQKNGVSPYQRVRDELHSQGLLYGLGREESRRRTDELTDALQLGEIAHRKAETLSGGQKRRVDIALGLMPRPKLLLLDEPSTGLDPQSRANLWEHILTMRNRYGTSLLLTTHYLDEADQFAERVMVVDRGRVIADDTASQLKDTFAGDRISLTVTNEMADKTSATMRRAAAVSGSTEPEPRRTELASGCTRLSVAVNHGEYLLARMIHDLHAEEVNVIAANIDQPTLDHVFLNLTGRSLREESHLSLNTTPAAEPASEGISR